MALCCASASGQATEDEAGADARLAELQNALTFHASFDTGTDADFAKGDARLFTCDKPGNQSAASPGFDTGGKTRRLEAGGVSGGMLEFTARDATWIFYPGEDNVSYASEDWAGSVSVWLRLDPEDDLDPGYTDPVQITPRAWNDASFFLDFDKDGDPRDFRLGAFADLTVWNADGKNVNDIPESERPLASVAAPPFGSDRWTHVVFTWEKFNTGKDDGVATLYLDGEPRGSITGWKQTFSWPDDQEVRLFLGLNYIGLLDEVSCFDRALTPAEVRFLHGLGDEVGTVVPAG